MNKLGKIIIKENQMNDAIYNNKYNKKAQRKIEMAKKGMEKNV